MLYSCDHVRIIILPICLIGDEGANDNDSNWSMECSTVLRVKTLHISSPILAAKSPFFYKVNLILYLTLEFFTLLNPFPFIFNAAFFQWDEGVRTKTCNFANQCLWYIFVALRYFS